MTRSWRAADPHPTRTGATHADQLLALGKMAPLGGATLNPVLEILEEWNSLLMQNARCVVDLHEDLRLTHLFITSFSRIGLARKRHVRVSITSFLCYLLLRALRKLRRLKTLKGTSGVIR